MKITKKQVCEWILCSLKKGMWAPLVVISIHAVALFFLNVYSFFTSFDIPMHFLGGVSITYFFIHCVICAMKKDFLGRPSFIVTILLVFLLTCTTTIFWEFAEWTLDVLFQTSIQVSLDDTLLDMILGISGGVLMIAIYFKDIYKETIL